jgi:hypothetical protein
MAERYGVKLKSNELAEVWALARDPSVPLHDRVVIASTFVYVWLDRANFGRFSECVAAAKLPPDCLYRRMADDLIEAADCGAVSGVCWHHASDTPDVWRAGGRLRSPAEVNASEVFDVATSAAAPPPGEPEPEPRGPQPHGVPGGTSDPANYRIMCEPFHTLADANEAVAAFTEGVRTLRQAWGIPDVAVCLEVNVRAPVGAGGEPDTRPEALAAAERDGLTKWVEMRMPVHASWGDAARVPGLLALCLSRAQADHQRRLMELVTGEPSPPETGGDPVLMATYLTQRATAAAELARAATDRAAQFLADAEAAITKLEKLRANRESPAAEKSDPGANPEAQPAVAGGE